jgi:hypothetical protein
MIHKRVFIVKAIDEDGDLVDHPSFANREFVTPQGIMQEVIDTEQRISYALEMKTIPDDNDRTYMDQLNGSELAIIETLTFGSKKPLVSRKLVEPRDPGKREIERLQAQLEEALKALKTVKVSEIEAADNAEEIAALRKDLQSAMKEINELKKQNPAGPKPPENPKK